MKTYAVIGALGCALISGAVNAQDLGWPDLRDQLFGDQYLVDAGSMISIDAPYRSDMDARTDIGATVTAPQGQMLESITVILDENPMPVSAVFDFAQPVSSFVFDVTMRVNGPTPLHVVVKTTQGQLLVAESFVKTSGQGACAAPPGTDPVLALATLGNMAIDMQEMPLSTQLMQTALLAGQNTGLGNSQRMVLDIQHPSHSGMQRDQISLLYIPARYIDTIAVDLDGARFVDITGSISLSEDPQISVAIPAFARSVDVMLTDTGGTQTTAHQSLQGS